MPLGNAKIVTLYSNMITHNRAVKYAGCSQVLAFEYDTIRYDILFALKN